LLNVASSNKFWPITRTARDPANVVVFCTTPAGLLRSNSLRSVVCQLSTLDVSVPSE